MNYDFFLSEDESYLNEDFYYKLNETIYNVKETKVIDKAFQDIVDNCVIENEVTDSYKFDINNPIIIKSFKTIEKQIKKMFNIDLKLKIDMTTQNLQYFACIYITKEDEEEVLDKTREIIEEDKYGYHYLKIKHADVYFQFQTFAYIKFFQLNGERKLNGRHLTAILMHEIGHKVYLKLKYYKEDDNTSALQINNGKPKFFAKGDYKAGCVITMIYILSFLFSIPYIKEYSRIESYSDRLSIEYGYGKEIYQFFTTIEMACKGKIRVDSDPKLSRLTDADYIRKQEMKKNIIKEINNPKNDKKTIESLKEILRYIENIEDEAENGHYTYARKNKKSNKKNFKEF